MMGLGRVRRFGILVSSPASYLSSMRTTKKGGRPKAKPPGAVVPRGLVFPVPQGCPGLVWRGVTENTLARKTPGVRRRSACAKRSLSRRAETSLCRPLRGAMDGNSLSGGAAG